VKPLAFTLCFVLTLALGVVASVMWADRELDGLAVFVGIGVLYGSATVFVYVIVRSLILQARNEWRQRRAERPERRRGFEVITKVNEK
jgi:hypothetical protein